MLDRLVLLRRNAASGRLIAASYAGGLVVGLAISLAILMGFGIPPAALFNEMIKEAFFTSNGLAQTTTLAIPLAAAGLSALLAMRVSFWNVGIEGQLWIGAVAATAVALADFGPPALRLPMMLIAAALAGMAVIGVSLVLKLRFSVNEVITTLLMASIAYLLVQHLLFGAWKDPATNFPLSPSFDPAEILPAFGWGRVHGGVFIVVALGIVIALVIALTPLGLIAQAIASNPRAAFASGLPVRATITGFVLASGALAGLAGALIVTGTEHRLSQGIGVGYTFSGIVIGFLARLNALAALFVAFALAGIYAAGDVLKVFYSVPEPVVTLIQGVVLLSVLGGLFAANFRIVVRPGP